VFTDKFSQSQLKLQVQLFPTKLSHKIQLVWNTENGHLPERWFFCSSTSLWFQMLVNHSLWLLSTLLSVYDFMVTKFDLFLSKSQHSSYNFLTSYCYDLTIPFVVVLILRSPLSYVTYFAFTLLTFLFPLITHNLQEHKSKTKVNTFRQNTIQTLLEPRWYDYN